MPEELVHRRMLLARLHLRCIIRSSTSSLPGVLSSPAFLSLFYSVPLLTLYVLAPLCSADESTVVISARRDVLICCPVRKPYHCLAGPEIGVEANELRVHLYAEAGARPS